MQQTSCVGRRVSRELVSPSATCATSLDTGTWNPWPLEPVKLGFYVFRFGLFQVSFLEGMWHKGQI